MNVYVQYWRCTRQSWSAPLRGATGAATSAPTEARTAPSQVVLLPRHAKPQPDHKELDLRVSNQDQYTIYS